MFASKMLLKNFLFLVILYLRAERFESDKDVTILLFKSSHQFTPFWSVFYRILKAIIYLT